MSSIRRLIGLTSVLFVLSACGGGGSSGDSGGQTPPPTHTVATSVTGSGSGSISPTSRSVSQGSTASFTISPAAGSTVASVSGCGGSLSGTTYTTGAISSSCAVVVDFTTEQQVNQPPVAQNLTIEVNEGSSVSDTLQASDADNDPLRYLIKISPAAGEVVLDTVSGSFQYTVSASPPGNDEFRFVAFDGALESDEAVVFININRRPLALPNSFSIEAGSTLAGQLEGQDADGDSLSYSITAPPGSGIVRLEQETGRFEFDAEIESPESVVFQFTVSDSQITSDPEEISIAVTPREPIEVVRLPASEGDEFTESVSIYGDRIIAGARGGNFYNPDLGHDIHVPGAAYIFARGLDGVWRQEARLTKPNDDPYEVFFGGTVRIWDETALVTSLTTDENYSIDSGHAYVFQRDLDGEWRLQARLTPSDTVFGDGFAGGTSGASAELTHDTLMVGAWAPNTGGFPTGSAYVFEKDETGSWIETQKIEPSEGVLQDGFGLDVSVFESTAVIPAQGLNKAFIFSRDDSGQWAEEGQIQATELLERETFGYSAALSGNWLLVGGSRICGLGFCGAVFVFDRSLGGWKEVAKLALPPETETDRTFGQRVALDGGRALISSSYWSATDVGRAYYFRADDVGAWEKSFKLEPADTDGVVRFGYSVAVDGSTGVVGSKNYIHVWDLR